MIKPNYQTSLNFNQKDFDLKEKLKKAGISIKETWKRGAEHFLVDLDKKKLTK